MAIPWFTVLKNVPWAAVISNAPAVAEGAKKLWQAVAKKTPSPAPPPASAPPASSADAQPLATLQAQLAAVEVAASDLRDLLLASSELIKALADQNAQLIERVENNRLRVLWLTLATVVLALIVAGNLALMFVR